MNPADIIGESLVDYVTRASTFLTNVQHMVCEYGQRHPKAECDCKFDPVVVTTGVGRLAHPERVGALTNAMESTGERTGCPELRVAIECVDAWPRLVALAVTKGWVHRNWRGCVCEACVEFRAAAGVRE